METQTFTPTREDLKKAFLFLRRYLTRDDLDFIALKFGRPGKPLSHMTVYRILDCRHNDLHYTYLVAIAITPRIISRVSQALEFVNTIITPENALGLETPFRAGVVASELETPFRAGVVPETMETFGTRIFHR